MVTGHSRTLLCENESHVRMKIIVLSFKFSADLLLLMFVWDETGSAKKKNLFYTFGSLDFLKGRNSAEHLMHERKIVLLWDK